MYFSIMFLFDVGEEGRIAEVGFATRATVISFFGSSIFLLFVLLIRSRVHIKLGTNIEKLRINAVFHPNDKFYLHL